MQNTIINRFFLLQILWPEIEKHKNSQEKRQIKNFAKTFKVNPSFGNFKVF
jgi:hypothetical protein